MASTTQPATFRSETNLMSQIKAVETRTAEALIDGSPIYLSRTETMEAIYEAELHIAMNLPDDALYRLHNQVYRTTVNGQDEYALPRGGVTAPELDEYPMMRVLSVELDTGSGLTFCKLHNMTRFRELDSKGSDRASAQNPYATIYHQNLIVRPIPGTEAADDKLRIRYVAVPRRRYKAYEGTTTSASSASSVNDNGSGFGSGWFNNPSEVRTYLRWVDGANAGKDHVVTAFSGTVFTVDPALTGSVATGAKFDVGSVSDIGEEFSEMIVCYASAIILAAHKENGLAQMYFELFFRSAQAVASRYQFL